MGIFDGLAGALNAVFGAPATIFPENGSGTVIRAVFRHELREISDEHGGMPLSRAAVFKAQKEDVVSLSSGDRVEIDGVSYR